MKKQSKLSLVNGNFSTQEALEVLMNLFSSKINFHELKSFSSQERFGYPDAHAEKRIPELQASMKQISAIIRELGDSQQEISIQSEVVITINKEVKRREGQGKSTLS